MATKKYGFKEVIVWKARSWGSANHELTARFDVKFDGTDHFSFWCPKCNCEAQIGKVHSVSAEFPALYFELECPECRDVGLRKIYITHVRPKDARTAVNLGNYPLMTFDVKFDNVDHFSFWCPKCKCDAQIGNVHRVRAEFPALYFELECPNCRDVGRRKIYLTYVRPKDARTAVNSGNYPLRTSEGDYAMENSSYEFKCNKCGKSSFEDSLISIIRDAVNEDYCFDCGMNEMRRLLNGATFTIEVPDMSGFAWGTELARAAINYSGDYPLRTTEGGYPMVNISSAFKCSKCGKSSFEDSLISIIHMGKKDDLNHVVNEDYCFDCGTNEMRRLLNGVPFTIDAPDVSGFVSGIQLTAAAINYSAELIDFPQSK